MMLTGQIYSGLTFEDLTASKTNAQFQTNGGIYIDLSAFDETPKYGKASEKMFATTGAAISPP